MARAAKPEQGRRLDGEGFFARNSSIAAVDLLRRWTSGETHSNLDIIAWTHLRARCAKLEQVHSEALVHISAGTITRSLIAAVNAIPKSSGPQYIWWHVSVMCRLFQLVQRFKKWSLDALPRTYVQSGCTAVTGKITTQEIKAF